MNPFQMLGAIKNPQSFIQQMMNNSQVMQNPMAKNAVNMLQNGDSEGLKKMAENLCHEKGITTDEAKQAIMSMFKQN